MPVRVSYPFERVALYIVAPLRTTASGHNYLLAMIDLFTSRVKATLRQERQQEPSLKKLLRATVVRSWPSLTEGPSSRLKFLDPRFEIRNTTVIRISGLCRQCLEHYEFRNVYIYIE